MALLLSKNQKSPVPIPHKEDLKIGRFENSCTIEKLTIVNFIEVVRASLTRGTK